VIDFVQDVFEWWNLIFVLPFVTALIIVLLQAIGGLHFHHDHHIDLGHMGHGHDVHVGGHDVHAGHEVGHAGAHHEVGTHHDGTGHGHHAEHGAHPQQESTAIRALSALGFGKVPMMIILQTMCFIWGTVGYASNQVLINKMHLTIVMVPVSIVAALLAALFLTGVVSSVTAKLMPSTETYAMRNEELAGRQGEVLFTVTSSSGTVRVRVEGRGLFDKQARVRPEEANIAPHTEVVLTSYDDEEHVFFVNPVRL